MPSVVTDNINSGSPLFGLVLDDMDDADGECITMQDGIDESTFHPNETSVFFIQHYCGGADSDPCSNGKLPVVSGLTNPSSMKPGTLWMLQRSSIIPSRSSPSTHRWVLHYDIGHLFDVLRIKAH